MSDAFPKSARKTIIIAYHIYTCVGDVMPGPNLCLKKHRVPSALVATIMHILMACIRSGPTARCLWTDQQTGDIHACEYRGTEPHQGGPRITLTTTTSCTTATPLVGPTASVWRGCACK